MSTDPNMLKVFSENIFGVKEALLTKPDIYEKIAVLQKRIADLTAQLGDVAGEVSHTITFDIIQTLRDRNREIEIIYLNPKSPVSRSEVSYITYRFASLIAHNGDYVGDAWYADSVYHTLPILNYQLEFSHQKIHWRARNGLYLSPTENAYKTYHIPENTLKIKGGVLTETERISYPDPVDAWSIQCVPPTFSTPHPNDMQSHPHAMGVQSPFSTICTGAENTFMSDWEGRRFYTASDFKNFIVKATQWLNHYNLTDSHNTATFPVYCGAAYENLVTDNVFEKCLKIVSGISTPLLDIFENTGGLYGAYPVEINEILSFDSAQIFIGYVSDMAYSLDGFGSIDSRPVGLYSHVAEPEKYSLDNTYSFPDTCSLVLAEMAELLKAMLDEDNYEDFDPQRCLNMLLLLRDVAYTIVLMRITADKSLTEEITGDYKMAETMCGSTFKNMLCYQIAAAAYIVTSGETPFYFRQGTFYIDHIRERLAAPKVLYSLHEKNSKDDNYPSPDATEILEHLDLPRFNKSYYGIG